MTRRGKESDAGRCETNGACRDKGLNFLRCLVEWKKRREPTLFSFRSFFSSSFFFLFFFFLPASLASRFQKRCSRGEAEWSTGWLVMPLYARSKEEGEKKKRRKERKARRKRDKEREKARETERERNREREKESGATKAAQPLWTFVSITHRLGEVSPRRRTAVILAQILSR